MHSDVWSERPDSEWRPWLVGMNSPSYGIEDHISLGTPTAAKVASTHDIGPTEISWSEVVSPRMSRVDGEVVADLFAVAGHLDRQEYATALALLAKHATLDESEPLRVWAVSLRLHAHFSLGNRQNVAKLSRTRLFAEMCTVGCCRSRRPWSCSSGQTLSASDRHLRFQ